MNNPTKKVFWFSNWPTMIVASGILVACDVVDYAPTAEDSAGTEIPSEVVTHTDDALVPILQSGNWLCSTTEPDGSTIREAWGFLESGEFVMRTEDSTGMAGYYEIDGLSISATLATLPTKPEASIQVAHYDEESLSFSFTTEQGTRQSECSFAGKFAKDQEENQQSSQPVESGPQVVANAVVCTSLKSAYRSRAIEMSGNEYATHSADCMFMPNNAYLSTVVHLEGEISKFRIRGATVEGYTATWNIVE